MALAVSDRPRRCRDPDVRRADIPRRGDRERARPDLRGMAADDLRERSRGARPSPLSSGRTWPTRGSSRTTGTNLGGARNSTRLIQHGGAPYVALLHDDDRWAAGFPRPSRRLSRCESVLRARLLRRANFIDDQGSVIHRFAPGLDEGMQERGDSCVLCTATISSAADRARAKRVLRGRRRRVRRARCSTTTTCGFGSRPASTSASWRSATRSIGSIRADDLRNRGGLGEHRLALLDAVEDNCRPTFRLDRRRARSGALLRIADDSLERGDRRRGLAHSGEGAAGQYPIAVLDPRMAALALVSIWEAPSLAATMGVGFSRPRLRRD